LCQASRKLLKKRPGSLPLPGSGMSEPKICELENDGTDAWLRAVRYWDGVRVVSGHSEN
jgi:hypothetical protein